VISAHPEGQQRISNVTPALAQRFAARFESQIPSFARYLTEPASGSGRRFAEATPVPTHQGTLANVGTPPATAIA